MKAVRLRFALLGALLATVVACDAPSGPVPPEAAALRVRGIRGSLCDPSLNPLCSTFITTTYAFDPSIAALPPGVSDWTLRVTQIGGSLQLFGAISHGGAPIVNIANMYVRFYVDNGDGALGSGDLQVVVRSNFGAAEIFCGIVEVLPTGDVVAPDGGAQLCPQNGSGFDDGSRFIFDGFRTADLTEPTWRTEGFEPLQAGDERAVWLFQVGNVEVQGATVVLLESAAAPILPYILDVVAGGPNGDEGGGEGGGDGDGDPGDGDGEEPPPPVDSIAPIISFAGNKGRYDVSERVRITCAASDAGSGLAAVDCPSLDVLAYTLDAGDNFLVASAIDSAGNSAVAQAAFVMQVSAGGLCTVAKGFAKSRSVGTALCVLIAATAWTGDRGKSALEKYLDAQRDRGITGEHADLILTLAEGLGCENWHWRSHRGRSHRWDREHQHDRDDRGGRDDRNDREGNERGRDGRERNDRDDRGRRN